MQCISHFTRGGLYFTLHAQYTSHFRCSTFHTSHTVGLYFTLHAQHTSHFTRDGLYFTLQAQYISHFTHGRLIFHTSRTVYITLHMQYLSHFIHGRLIFHTSRNHTSQFTRNGLYFTLHAQYISHFTRSVFNTSSTVRIFCIRTSHTLPQRSCLLGYDAMLLREWFSRFRRIVVPSSHCRETWRMWKSS